MASVLHPYAAYKPTSVEWLDDVPSHWQLMPGRVCYYEEKVPNRGFKETTVLSLSYGRIVVKPAEDLHGLVPESFETYQVIDPGTIVVRPTDLQNDWNSLRFGLSKHRGIITSAYMALHTTGLVTSEYGHLLLHAYDLKKVFYGLGSGLRQNLRWGDLKYLPCPVPPLSEQTSIVRYLDRADSRLQHYISAKERLIELLTEQKQAIINRAVTRGLDPNVPLKPSGVEWLGDVPAHWEVRRAKHFYREVDERSGTGAEELMSVSHKTGVTPRKQSVTMFLAESNVGYKVCRPGDIAINTMWAYMAALGVSRQIGLVSPSYGVYRPLEDETFNSDYVDELLRTEGYRSEYLCRSRGITSSRLRLYPDSFLSIPLVCPSREEQDSIVGYLDRVTAEINASIDRALRQIELMQEYRTRLTADVVTGKLDVRGAVAEEAKVPTP